MTDEISILMYTRDKCRGAWQIERNGETGDEQTTVGWTRKKGWRMTDLNGHIGRGNTGYERWHGGFGHGEKNQEGDNILEFTQAYDLALGNSSQRERNTM